MHELYHTGLKYDIMLIDNSEDGILSSVHALYIRAGKIFLCDYILSGGEDESPYLEFVEKEIILRGNDLKAYMQSEFSGLSLSGFLSSELDKIMGKLDESLLISRKLTLEYLRVALQR